jgi:hypothetical protein
MFRPTQGFSRDREHSRVDHGIYVFSDHLKKIEGPTVLAPLRTLNSSYFIDHADIRDPLKLHLQYIKLSL